MGTNIYDLLLNKQINKEFIDFLGEQGKLIYNDTFDKPFFQVIVRGKYTYKGALGNKTLRILFPDGDIEYLMTDLKNYIESYPDK